jgi:hypothetical protein
MFFPLSDLHQLVTQKKKTVLSLPRSVNLNNCRLIRVKATSIAAVPPSPSLPETPKALSYSTTRAQLKLLQKVAQHACVYPLCTCVLTSVTCLCSFQSSPLTPCLVHATSVQFSTQTRRLVYMQYRLQMRRRIVFPMSTSR